MKMKQMAVGMAVTMGVAGSYAAVTTDYFGAGENAFTIDFVDIGGAGNEADEKWDGKFWDKGYGAVDYNYRIGQTEITVDQFLKAAAEVSGISSGNNENVLDDIDGNVPVAAISVYDAMKFVNYLTTGDPLLGVYELDEEGTALLSINRDYRNDENMAYVLPTADEWYKAAYYNSDEGTYSVYADGSDDGAEITQEGWNFDWGNDGAPWAVGSGALEQNGTYDMMGNVMEFTETVSVYAEDYQMTLGGYYDINLDGLASSTDKMIYPADGGYAAIGFRVAAIPEPASMALIGLFGGGVLFIRRIFMV